MINKIEKEWEYKGYKCMVIFYKCYRCGYVYVPREHKYYLEWYGMIPMRCHGGLTYSGRGIYEKRTTEWVIGFDCAHWGMDKPDFETVIKYGGNPNEFTPNRLIMEPGEEFPSDAEGEVRTLDFCIKECESIVDQLME